MRHFRWPLIGLLLGALSACGEEPASDSVRETGLAPDTIVSGYAFLTPETQSEQDDDFLNPANLWVDEGGKLFLSEIGVSAACASCHGEGDMRLDGAATRYPTIDHASGELVNLEGRINLCRTRHQQADPLEYESEPLLSLTTYVASLSRGQAISTALSTDEQVFYEVGKTYFNTRRGQFNLSCRECHDLNWGKQLRGDTISQGHSNGFPAYRLEWQTLGSLHRRFRDCDAGIRAEPRTYGSADYLALELYLRVRAQGLPMETPAIRR